MKSISYFHEKQFYSKKKKDLKNNDDFPAILLEYSAYILHPCTIILGIWHPFNDPKKLFGQSSNKSQWQQQIYDEKNLYIYEVIFEI